MILSLALLLAAADPPAPAAPPPPPTLLQRIQQRFAADPSLAASFGRPAPQMREVDWMIGTWDVSSVLEERGGPPASGTSVVAPAFGGAWLEIRDTYPGNSQNLAYLGYGAVEGRWVTVALDNLMNANRSSAVAWTGDSIAFEGDYLILGVPAHLRQTIERHGTNDFEVLAEELVGGRWRRVTVRYYHRRSGG
jgi:hypothetical protein